MNADEHPALARRLVVDETLPLADRVAGLLLLCYGQPLTRLAKLTADHIAINGHLTSIRFGRTDVEVSEPIGQLLRALLVNRRGHATTAVPEQSPWLFPGAQPGRPVTPRTLRIRLGAYGIDARAARTSLLLDLASELPPVVLADLLGLHPNTAVRWVRAANGDWSQYAAAKAMP